MDQRVIRNRLWAIAALAGLVVSLWVVCSTAFRISEPKPLFGANRNNQSVSAHPVNAVECRVSLTVTSPLPFANVPMDPRIDFGALIANLGLTKVLDPNSIQVIDVTTHNEVPCAVAEDFAYGDDGRVEWVIEDPRHTKYEIRFRAVAKRPPLRPKAYTSVIGVGDLLRFNAGAPRRIVLPRPARLIDLNGNGKRDLVGCWGYAYRPGWPWSGVVSYPRVGNEDRFDFGDLVRVRYLIGTEEDRRQQELTKRHGIPMGDVSGDHKHFSSSSVLMQCDFADLNADGLIDIAFRPWYHGELQFYLNTGKRDAGGMPVFRGAADVKTEINQYGNFRAVDLDLDGAVDLVVNDRFLRNKNPDGWPIKLAKPVRLGAGVDACFYDVDGDGALDAVGTSGGPEDQPASHRVTWRKNLRGVPPKFGQPKLLKDIGDFWCAQIAAVNDGRRRGLLVQHDVYEAVSFYEQLPPENGKPRFRKYGVARSRSAVMSLGDQATPYVCDWDGDGDRDMLIGGGYGWPRVVINNGTNERPAWRKPQYLYSQGKPIRVLVHKVLDAPKYTHRMGYPFPAYVDWDHDGLPDLMLPNDSNRIFWYRNIGTRKKPRFGPRLQVICDGYPDSPEKRAASGRLIVEKWEGEPDKRSPFGWRRRASFVDLNGDGLRDLVTQEWEKNRLRLFARYRDQDGTLRLKEDRLLRFKDGRPISLASVLGRNVVNHAGYSMLADWDNDGLFDIIYSVAGWLHDGSIFLLRNVGTRTDPVFAKPENLKCFGEPLYLTRHGPHPWVGDFDGDHKPDLVCYVEWSVYPVYSHVALTMKQRPTYVLTKPRRRQFSARRDSAAKTGDMSAPAFTVPNNEETSAAEKARTRNAFWEIVGRPPFNKKPPLNARVVGQTDAGAYVRKKVRYGNASNDIVWAWLLIPKHIKTPAPAIICLPGSFMTPNWGKDAPAGLAGPLIKGDPEAYGRDFALAGYITLCPDYPCTGERTTPGLKSHDTTQFDKRFPNWTRMGMSTWDVSRAVDLLLTIPEVDGRRIGCTGWSQGGLTTILGAAMDPRIAVSVSVCGWSPWRGRPATNIIAPYNFPRLRPYVEAKHPLPLDLDQVAALIAPRPLLNINAEEDRYFPNRRILTDAEAEIATYYDSLGAGEKFQAVYVAGDHAYSTEVAKASRQWFDRWLGDKP